MPWFLFLVAFAFPTSQALEKQPASDYHARRVALGSALHGGVAILFAAEEPVLDFDPYRQDSDFYYLTGWNEPGAALLIVGPANEPERPGQPRMRATTRKSSSCPRAICAWKPTPAPRWTRQRRA